MVNTVASQTLNDGAYNTIMRFTTTGDGSGEETAVTKVTASTLMRAPAHLKIKRIVFATKGGVSLRILWDATTPVLAYECPANLAESVDFGLGGALLNPKAAGYTGNIKFTTVSLGAASSYTITLYMTKKW